MIAEKPILGQKENFFNSSGKAIKKASDGITIQKMEADNSLIFVLSPVSTCSQIKASIEVSGKEASIAPKVENRFPASEIATTSKAVIITFMICVIRMFT